MQVGFGTMICGTRGQFQDGATGRSPWNFNKLELCVFWSRSLFIDDSILFVNFVNLLSAVKKIVKVSINDLSNLGAKLRS